MKSTTDSGPSMTPINKKYSWYPNYQLTSPMKTGMQDESPAPKSIKSYHKHSSIQVRNDPTTPMSVQGGSSRHFGDARFGQLNFDQASSAVKNKPLGTSVLSMSKMGSFKPKQGTTPMHSLPTGV